MITLVRFLTLQEVLAQQGFDILFPLIYLDWSAPKTLKRLRIWHFAATLKPKTDLPN